MKIKKSIAAAMSATIMLTANALEIGKPFAMNASASTAHTREEAVAWARAQQGVGIDYDGAYGNQCVDLIKAYYDYLGVPVTTGNGKDYATNALPDGWIRI